MTDLVSGRTVVGATASIGLVVALLFGLETLDRSPSSAAAEAPRAEAHARSSPSSFEDDISAELALAGSRAWMIVSGVPHDRTGSRIAIRTFERDASGEDWRTLPQLPGQRFDSFVSVVAVGPEEAAIPCVGYQADRMPEIRCLENGRWRRGRGVPAKRGTRLVDLESSASEGAVALYSRRAREGLTYTVSSFAGAGKWKRLGPSFDLDVGLVQIVIPAEISELRIGVQEQGPGAAKRFILGLKGNRWVRETPTLSAPLGSQLDGPVIAQDRIFFPVISARRTPWTFGVASYSAGDSGWTFMKDQPLSQGDGSAQGTLAVVDGQPWAIWQENGPAKESLFRTYIRAAAVSDDGSVSGTPTLLWSGLSVGPGSVQLVDGADASYAVYMRGDSQEEGLRATVAEITVPP